jgi:hypothetical protein
MDSHSSAFAASTLPAPPASCCQPLRSDKSKPPSTFAHSDRREYVNWNVARTGAFKFPDATLSFQHIIVGDLRRPPPKSSSPLNPYA